MQKIGQQVKPTDSRQNTESLLCVVAVELFNVLTVVIWDAM